MELNEKTLHPAMDELIAAGTRVKFASTDYAANGDLMMAICRTEKYLQPYPTPGLLALGEPLRKIVLTEYPDGWRGQLLNGAGNAERDTTVDVYPSCQVLLSRIEESKTWFDAYTPNPSTHALPPQ